MNTRFDGNDIHIADTEISKPESKSQSINPLPVNKLNDLVREVTLSFSQNSLTKVAGCIFLVHMIQDYKIYPHINSLTFLFI